MSSHTGILHEYAPKLTAFEFTPPNASPTKPDSLLFIGGLTDGLLTVPYVPPIAHHLSQTTWSVFNLLLSSSYGGWGVGSLDKDVEEIAQAVEFVKKLKGSEGKVVIMGHSTGSQDVLHYVSAPNPVKDGQLGGTGLVRPCVDGAIMQAPASDREAVVHTLKEKPELRGLYEELVGAAKKETFKDGLNVILQPSVTAKLEWPSNTPVSAYRFLSLASPDSPEHPAEDDKFSSDLPDSALAETFGKVGERGLLRAKLMALYSGNDEFAAPWVDKEGLLSRWAKVAGDKWDEGSGVIPGASHNVKDVGQDYLIEHVTNYLETV